jgi:hypothetical protein
MKNNKKIITLLIKKFWKKFNVAFSCIFLELIEILDPKMVSKIIVAEVICSFSSKSTQTV